jgi:bifunctional DNA-binding transcriptional regulator/antitoxin component of YhaV-PrlF toxin-antitoxin module
VNTLYKPLPVELRDVLGLGDGGKVEIEIYL